MKTHTMSRLVSHLLRPREKSGVRFRKFGGFGPFFGGESRFAHTQLRNLALCQLPLSLSNANNGISNSVAHSWIVQ